MELEKHWQQVFTERARSYTRPFEISHWTEKGFAARVKRLSSEIRKRLAPGHRVLDLGCGPGPYAALFERPVLLDYAAPVFERLPTCQDGQRVCGDFTHLPFRDAVFDGVLSVGMLQCHRLFRAHLTGLARVLKPGAWFIIETLNSECAALLQGLQPRPKNALRGFNASPGDRCHFVLDEFVVYHAGALARWFGEAGLPVSECRYLYAVGAGRFLPVTTRRSAKSFYLAGVKSCAAPDLTKST